MTDTDHRLTEDYYAAALKEQLSDLVDTMNDALVDGFVFNFGVGQVEGKFALVSLTATAPTVDLLHPKT
jgi:hypothetical protein